MGTFYVYDAPRVTDIDAPRVMEVNRKVRHRCVMARDDPHFRLRLPADLKARVEEAARAANRSINAEIVQRLEGSFIYPEIDVDLETLIQQILEHAFTSEEFVSTALASRNRAKAEARSSAENPQPSMPQRKSALSKGIAVRLKRKP